MIFVISDNHFSDYDGKNGVISIFKRQYKNSAEMNTDMIRKWNSVVKSDDTIYSVGDFAWCLKDFEKYEKMLNGKKIFILGNHDFEGEIWHSSFDGADWQKSRLATENALFVYLAIVTHKGRSFLLVHRPEDVPKWWKGWVIHGHHHWMLPKYPFIDGKNKNINVACELVAYTPVDFDRILSLDIDKIKTMDSINSIPKLW